MNSYILVNQLNRLHIRISCPTSLSKSNPKTIVKKTIQHPPETSRQRHLLPLSSYSRPRNGRSTQGISLRSNRHRRRWRKKHQRSQSKQDQPRGLYITSLHVSNRWKSLDCRCKRTKAGLSGSSSASSSVSSKRSHTFFPVKSISL